MLKYLNSEDVTSDYDKGAVSTYQDDISNLYVDISSYIKSLVPPQAEPIYTPPVQSNLRLPKFDLSKFNVSYEKWLAFQIFLKHLSIRTTQSYQYRPYKFQCLLSSLSGELLDLIKGLHITPENYEAALNS